MTLRSSLLLAAMLAAIPSTSSAGELRLGVGAGAAAAAYDPCSYDGSCSTPRSTTAGPAPLLFAGYRITKPLRNTWALRFGGMLSAILVAPGFDTNASVATGWGEFGVQFDRFAVDGHAGISAVRMSYDDMHGAGGTIAIGGTASVRLSPELAVFARAEAHAMMHGTAAAAFAGVGLEWTP